jgi:Ca2+-binding EF-hand superfamily protein
MAIGSDSRGMRRPLSGDEVADLYLEFEVCDTDADGHVAFEEFDRLLTSVDSGLDDRQRRSEFSRIDADQNGLIDLAEFKRWWQGD